MKTSYKVRIWAIAARKNKLGNVTSYSVRWKVENKECYESFKLRTPADSFRSELIAAQRAGRPFDTETGLPVPEKQELPSMAFFEAARRYVAVKWPDLAATARQTTVEALIRVLPAFVAEGPNAPPAKEVRSALRQWGFNPPRLESGNAPAKVVRILSWLAVNTEPIELVAEPSMLRELQRRVTRRLDGSAYAPTVARRTRSVLSNLLDYARLELKVLGENPLRDVKWTKMPKGNRKIDKRAVPNPVQARTLLRQIGETPRSGPHLVAFFALMYFAALRPEEATFLGKTNLSLPPVWTDSETGQAKYDWGTIYLDSARPYVDGLWTDSGEVGEERPLKAREEGAVRAIPCCPELTEILWNHVTMYGYGPDGRLFVGEHGGLVSKVTYTKIFRAARKAALSEEAQRSPLASRAYDLRHACVSTWLFAGVDPALVALWAGQSIKVLLEVYASFLDGGEEAAKRKIENVLGPRRL